MNLSLRVVVDIFSAMIGTETNFESFVHILHAGIFMGLAFLDVIQSQVRTGKDFSRKRSIDSERRVRNLGSDVKTTIKALQSRHNYNVYQC